MNILTAETPKVRIALLCAALPWGSLRLFAQQLAPLGPRQSKWPSIARPYDAAPVPPIRLTNSVRLRHNLILRRQTWT